jgi:hypothetical protein
MNYKSIVQHLDFPDYFATRNEWEYLYITPTQKCYTLQDFCNLISDYLINCEELKLNSTDQNSWYVIFKKGGSIRSDFPGEIIVGEYTEDPPENLPDNTTVEA